MGHPIFELFCFNAVIFKCTRFLCIVHGVRFKTLEEQKGALKICIFVLKCYAVWNHTEIPLFGGLDCFKTNCE